MGSLFPTISIHTSIKQITRVFLFLSISLHRSPTDSRNNKIWSSELSRHLQFDLVDTTGMTEEQLREIPYTVVETQNTQNRKRNSTNSLKVHKNTYAKDRVDRIRLG